jgi:hypothetical protein
MEWNASVPYNCLETGIHRGLSISPNWILTTVFHNILYNTNTRYLIRRMKVPSESIPETLQSPKRVENSWVRFILTCLQIEKGNKMTFCKICVHNTMKPILKIVIEYHVMVVWQNVNIGYHLQIFWFDFKLPEFCLDLNHPRYVISSQKSYFSWSFTVLMPLLG